MIGSINGITGIDALHKPLAVREQPATTTGAVANAGMGQDFLQALQEAAGSSVHTLQQAEFSSLAGIVGKADIQQVVDQVMAAQRTLSATMAIRNKVIAAWQEISRMQI